MLSFQSFQVGVYYPIDADNNFSNFRVYKETTNQKPTTETMLQETLRNGKVVDENIKPEINNWIHLTR